MSISTALQRRTIDPAVVAAVAAAPAFRPRYLVPILRSLAFHLYFVPTSLVFLPLFVIRCIVPALRPNRHWSFLTALAILNVRRAIRNYVRFGFQPIQPRRGGWRDGHGVLATVLNLLNYSGPGGSVTRPKEAVDAAVKITKRIDKVWIEPPPLHALVDVLQVRTQGPAKGTVKAKLYNGPPLLDPTFAKLPTRGFWFMHKEGVLPPSAEGRGKHPKRRTRPVILYFHGGAGVTFSAADLFMGQCLATNLAKTSGVDVFSVDYLLAPHGPFPVPLMQGLAAYLYLVNELGYRPDQIFIGGDSFGGWLTLVVERYLRTYANLVLDNPESLTRHGRGSSFIPGLVLLSPGIAHDHGNSQFASRRTNVGFDVIDLRYANWGAEAQQLHPKYRHINPMPLSDPWNAHQNKPKEELQRLPPVYIAVGDKEVLRDEGIHFADLIRGAKGLDANDKEVVIEAEPHMPHDYFTLNTERARAKRVYARIGTWIRGISKASGGAR